MKKAKTFDAAYYRSYSRLSLDGTREKYEESTNRVVNGLTKIGKLDENESSKLRNAMLKLEATASGRALWYAGTNSSFKPQNYYGLYNCVSIHTESLHDLELLFYLQMLGCGVGAVLEQHLVDKFPKIENYLDLQWKGNIGDKGPFSRQENTTAKCIDRDTVEIVVGDSKEGWSNFYYRLLELAINCNYCEQNGIDHCGTVKVIVDVSNIRAKGEKLKGFGGTANPSYFQECFEKVVKTLNKATGRKLTQLEVTLLIDEPAKLVVSGNVRRSAGIRQYNSDSPLYKQNLWQPGDDGIWRIDPERDALRMANHTRNYHSKPSYQTIYDAVSSQFTSGEGAINYVPESLVRTNADLITNQNLKNEFIEAYENGKGKEFLASLKPDMTDAELAHRINRYGANPCIPGDTWIHTENGPRKVDELIGKQTNVYVDGELFSTTTDGFFYTGTKETVNLNTKEGHSLRLTPDHKVLKVVKSTPKKEYTEWVETKDLAPGDQIKIHDHSSIETWSGNGTYEQGWLLGDGCQANTVKLAELAKEYGIVKGDKLVTKEIEKGSYQFYCGFLRGLFDTNGSPQGEIKIRLSLSNLQDLQAVQRMLLRLGIASTIYKVKAGHELSITKENMAVFEEKVGFKDPAKNEKLKQILSSYTKTRDKENFVATVESIEQGNVESVYDCTVPQIHRFDGNGVVISNCYEILGKDFLCNLSEVYLNNLDPSDMDSQKEAFQAATLAVAALLHQDFPDEKMSYSRNLDPIVGVGITGLFDFFVNAIGVDYAQWMVENRPMQDENRGQAYQQLEQRYLSLWYRWVKETIEDYCSKHNLKVPNRFTCVKPSGTLSLLVGASPGWHPPKASHMIRRITFSKEDPIALAYNAMGYRITPAHGDTDENGNLLDDPWDSRVNEWLVEIPITTSWGHLEGADQVKLENIPATAQMALWETVQKYWTGHNTSATVELRENEIESLSEYIYNSIQDPNGVYTSVALLARFDNYQSFPRLPFEPISKEVYDQRVAEIEANMVFNSFDEALAYFDYFYLNQDQVQGPSGCDSAKCLTG